MVEITKSVASYLIKNFKVGEDIGYYCEQGAIVDNTKLIIVCLKGKSYLSNIKEFEQKGVLIKLKNKIK